MENGMLERVNYFAGEYLTTDDFQAEQNYYLSKQRYHNRYMHTWGIASGLDVQIASNTSITVYPGMAIDGQGREIVLSEPKTLQLDAGLLAPEAGAESQDGVRKYLTISYAEALGDYTTGNGVTGFKRIAETPLIRITPPLSGNWEIEIYLAMLRIRRGVVFDVDKRMRRYVGIYTGGITFEQRSDRDANVRPSPTEQHPLSIQRTQVFGADRQQLPALQVNAPATVFHGGLSIKQWYDKSGQEQPGNIQLEQNGQVLSPVPPAASSILPSSNALILRDSNNNLILSAHDREIALIADAVKLGDINDQAWLKTNSHDPTATTLALEADTITIGRTDSTVDILGRTVLKDMGMWPEYTDGNIYYDVGTVSIGASGDASEAELYVKQKHASTYALHVDGGNPDEANKDIAKTPYALKVDGGSLVDRLAVGPVPSPPTNVVFPAPSAVLSVNGLLDVIGGGRFSEPLQVDTIESTAEGATAAMTLTKDGHVHIPVALQVETIQNTEDSPTTAITITSDGHVKIPMGLQVDQIESKEEGAKPALTLTKEGDVQIPVALQVETIQNTEADPITAMTIDSSGMVHVKTSLEATGDVTAKNITKLSQDIQNKVDKDQLVTFIKSYTNSIVIELIKGYVGIYLKGVVFDNLRSYVYHTGFFGQNKHSRYVFNDPMKFSKDRNAEIKQFVKNIDRVLDHIDK